MQPPLETIGDMLCVCVNCHNSTAGIVNKQSQTIWDSTPVCFVYNISLSHTKKTTVFLLGIALFHLNEGYLLYPFQKEPEESSNCCVPNGLDKWTTLLKLRTFMGNSL